MSTGRSARSRTHPAAPVNPSAHTEPSCLNCARFEGENTALRSTLDRLLGALAGTNIAKVAEQTPPQETKPLPKAVARALILQFPERTRERAAHETMARDLLAAGESEGTIAQMIADGRQIDL